MFIVNGIWSRGRLGPIWPSQPARWDAAACLSTMGESAGRCCRGSSMRFGRTRGAGRWSGGSSRWSSRRPCHETVMNDLCNAALRRIPTVLLLGLVIGLGIPASGWAQLVGKGLYVEVAKGTKLCSNTTLEQSKGALDPGKVFWRVSSHVRANGTQTVAAFVLERSEEHTSE